MRAIALDFLRIATNFHMLRLGPHSLHSRGPRKACINGKPRSAANEQPLTLSLSP
jgi:hypothetical protein